MSLVIPNFAKRVAPLRTVLDDAFPKSGGKRTAKSIQNIQLASLSWGKQHLDAFRDLQDQLRESVTLAHRDPSLELCVFTDASTRFHGAVATQCCAVELEKKFEEQRHMPLAFLSAEFRGAKCRWSTVQQEAYTIYNCFKKLDYLLAPVEDVHIFTDHRKLLFIFNPRSADPPLAQHVITKSAALGSIHVPVSVHY